MNKPNQMQNLFPVMLKLPVGVEKKRVWKEEDLLKA
jgi:hypothetical protein